jgi:transcriptional regulator with XRE-family HTH domain
MQTTMNYGPQIKTARTALGLSQPEVAKLLGSNTSSISTWESGKAVPGRKNMRRLETKLFAPARARGAKIFTPAVGVPPVYGTRAKTKQPFRASAHEARATGGGQRGGTVARAPIGEPVNIIEQLRQLRETVDTVLGVLVP